MDEFTKEEIDRINLLYGTDFKDVTPDDVKLIQRWEQYATKNNEEMQAKFDLLKEENDERIKQARSLHTKAMKNLNELVKAAKARYERFDDGQEE